MSFFKSEFVQKELEEISRLQEDIYSKIYAFGNMDKEDKLTHIEMLEDLLNKQRILYTRMSLSDDPEAKKMKETIMDQAIQLGFPANTDIAYVFGNMTNIIDNMKKTIRES